MPNPKTGTVTFDVAKAVAEIKAGKVEFRLDKTGIIHSPIGKISFSAEQLAGNAHALLAAVVKAKPASAKGKYVRKITLTSTHGPRRTDRWRRSRNRRGRGVTNTRWRGLRAAAA